MGPFRRIGMVMSRFTPVLSGAAAVLGLAVMAGDATAQYYPRPYPEPYYARPARPLPPPMLYDDDSDAPPGVYGAPSQQPYRRDPPVARYPLEQQPQQQPTDRGYQDRNYSDRSYDGRGYEARPLPPPSPYDGRPSYDNRPYDNRP